MQQTVYSQQARALCLLLRALRKDTRMTQQQLAAALHKPQSFVAKYEAGGRPLDVMEWLGILEALGADPVSFLRVLLATKPSKPGTRRK
jgi:transcriptional regulator with XRE-family HTH domain